MDTSDAPRMSLRSLRSLFGDAWKLYKERWRGLVEIVLLPMLVVVLGGVLVGLDLGWLLRVLGILVIFVGWIMFMFVILPLVYSIHHGAGVDASYKTAIGWFWPFVWVVILEILAVLGGYVMLIIPGIFLGVAMSFVAYVFVIEGRRGIDALRQSKDYVKGYWWAIFGRTLLLIIIYIAVLMIIRIPVTFLAGQVAGGIVSALIVLFFIPFAMIYQYVIFGNLRELKLHLAEAQTKEGSGFIKVSAIVGIVVPVILLLTGIFFAGVGAFHMMGRMNQYAPPPGYGVYYHQ